MFWFEFFDLETSRSAVLGADSTKVPGLSRVNPTFHLSIFSVSHGLSFLWVDGMMVQ